MPPRIPQSPLERSGLNISTSAGIQSYERGLVVPKTSVRADTQSFIGRTIEQIGAQGSRLASQLQAKELKEKDETDRAAASETFLQFSDQERELLTNLTGRRLGAAKGVTKEAQDNYDKLIRTFSDGLENEEQRIYFRSLADTRRSAGLNKTAAHEAREDADYIKTGQIGLINEGIQYGADNFKDLSMIALAEDYIKTGVYGLMEGASTVAKEAMLKQKLSTMHEAIYNRWLAVDPETAQNYYKQYQDKFDPLKKAGIEKEITEKVLLRQAQNKTDDIIAEHPNDLQAQLDEVRKIQDPLQQSEVNKRIKIRHQEDQQLIRLEEEKFKNSMTEQILNAKTVGEAYQLADSAPAKHRKEMLNVVESRIQRDNVITKIPKLIEARARIDAGDITTPQQLWREYRLDLSRQDWTTLDAYLRDGGKAQIKDSYVRSIYTSISGKAANKTPETYQAIWEVVSRNTKALGRKPDDDTLRKWIKNLMMTGEYQRRFLWDPDASYIKAKQAGRIDEWLPKVDTEEEAAQITAELKKIPGQKVNEQTIREYKKYHLMGIPLPEQNR